MELAAANGIKASKVEIRSWVDSEALSFYEAVRGSTFFTIDALRTRGTALDDGIADLYCTVHSAQSIYWQLGYFETAADEMERARDEDVNRS